jgi:hypothetical protein
MGSRRRQQEKEKRLRVPGRICLRHRNLPGFEILQIAKNKQNQWFTTRAVWHRACDGVLDGVRPFQRRTL